MKKFGWRFLGFVASLALMPAILLTCVQWRVSSMDYFREEYAKYDVLERVDMQMDDLLYLTEEMMAYLYDKREELQVTVPIGGEELLFFSEKEIRHMVDVKNLFSAGLDIRNGCLVFTLAAVIVMFAKKKGRTFLRTLQAGIGVFFAACGLLVALMLTDFNKYFTQFHLIFFDNDDWILDERVDRLINIVPEGFFSDTAFWIGGVFLGVCLLLFVGAEIILRLWGRKYLTEEKNGSVEIH